MSPLVGLLVISGIGSVAFAAIAATTADTMVSAALLTTYSAANTMLLLLVDFTGVVLSPDDYGILGPRPVGSRTYFSARLAAVGVYVGAISLAIASLPSVVYGVRVNVLAVPATILAVLLCNLATAVLVINGYVVLLRWVHPARLRRAMSYLQLVAATSFYVLYFLATRAFQGAMFERLDAIAIPWLWIVPSTWFAAFIAVAGGGPPVVWLASAAAVSLSILCVPLAAGRLSLDYARRVGELSSVGEAARRPRVPRLPAFTRDEARAVALLVRAQFRFDQRFRMGVLGILPLTIFYVLLGMNQGALDDPFLGTSRPSGPGVFMAVVFIPMTLHAALSVSESWRAAWIFFATPVSHARIVIAAKNFVAIYFLGAYVVVLTAIWSYFFERVWHAAIHALVAGLLAHLMLQLTVIVKPSLPFAAEPRKAERSSMMFWVIMIGSVVGAIFPLILPRIYRSGAITAATLLLLIAMTAAIEYALRIRVDEAIGDLEFTS